MLREPPLLSLPSRPTYCVSLTLSCYSQLWAARTLFLASEREIFCVSLTCERERYIPWHSPPQFSTPSSFPPAIGIGGVGVVVVDVVVVVAMAASCQQATVGYIVWITPRMSERRDATPPRSRHNNPTRRRNPPSLMQKRRR
jgi:hypothetical protein